MSFYRLLLGGLLISVVYLAPAHSSSGVDRYNQGYGYKTTMTDNDPVSMGNGELIQQIPLLSLEGLMGLDFSVDYNSNRATVHGYEGPKSPFAVYYLSWNHNQVRRMVEMNYVKDGVSTPYINYFLGDKTVVFRGDGAGGYESVGPVPYQMKKDADVSWLVDPQSGLVHIFRTREYTVDFDPDHVTRNGELMYTLDRNGNRLAYNYSTDNFLTSINDGLGRSLSFTYIANGNWYESLGSVTDGNGRSVGFSFSMLPGCSAPYGFLSSITDAEGNETTINYEVLQEWECDFVQSITRPLGNTPAQQTWDSNMRVATQTDALGNATSFAWSNNPDGTLAAVITDPDATDRRWSHAQQRYPTAMTDGRGQSASISYDTNNRITGVTDRMGDDTTFEWDSDSGKPTRLQNAEGHAVSYGYTAQQQTFTHPGRGGVTATFTFHDRTRIDYPDGTSETFVYDAKGNPTTHTDQRGKTWTTTYNDRGQPLTVTNPEGGVTTYSYNADATLASRSDTDTGTTSYGYDAYKRLNFITRPDTTTVAITYDLNDRVTSITDENGNLTQYQTSPNSPQNAHIFWTPPGRASQGTISHLNPQVFPARDLCSKPGQLAA